MDTKTMIREVKSVMEKHKDDLVPTCQTNISAMCRDILPKLELLAEYEEIGTLDECQKGVEAQTRQKIIFSSERYREYEDFICPNCKHALQTRRKGINLLYKLNFCYQCGQALDWGDSD